MWQSPDDRNNPWRPFRVGEYDPDNVIPTNNPNQLGTTSIPTSASSGDENWNWNSVKETSEICERLKDPGQYEYRGVPRKIPKNNSIAEYDCSGRNNQVEPNARNKKYSDRSVFVDDFIIQVDSDRQNGWSQSTKEGRHVDDSSLVKSSDHVATEEGNQWSPFLHSYWDVSGPGGQVKFEFHQEDDSIYSERSSYSTDTDDVPDEEYEIVDNEGAAVDNEKDNSVLYQTVDLNGESRDETDSVRHTEDGVIIGDGFNTPPTSPSVDERYHTAPNSPSSDRDGFCVVNMPRDVNSPLDDKGATGSGINVINILDKQNNNGCVDHSCDNIEWEPKDKMVVTGDHNDDKRAADTIASGRSSPLDTFTETITACLQEAIEESKLSDSDKRDIANFRRYTERYDRSRLPKMELPPFIDVENIQYEADPKTGAVRTVGKGSFGQVFKARFADPALRHLRIVVKEFNEEYTNRQEILDEAKRLLYLGDSGYVPVCYGLVYLGHVDNPTYGLVQEYVGAGLTLEQVLWDQYNLEIHLWLSIAFQACEGLARFHEKGILLNDIKSNNIILEFFRDIVRIKYIDFGLATDMRGKRYKNTKSLEDFVYLAPEVRKDGGVTNIASDIFSLGYMLEQICKQAGVHELSFMTRLCMDIEPEARLPVRAAANIIYEHMVTFRYDTSSLCR